MSKKELSTEDKLFALKERLDRYQKQSQNLVDMCADMYNDLTALKQKVERLEKK